VLVFSIVVIQIIVKQKSNASKKPMNAGQSYKTVFIIVATVAFIAQALLAQVHVGITTITIKYKPL